MRAGTAEIVEFYSQLALLTRAGLPLPGSLQQLASNARQPGFQQVLAELQERTSRGEKLADALRRYPEHFDRFHVDLLAAGEASGTLPETLHSVARYVHFCHVAGGRVQEVLAYPFVTIHLAAILFLCLAFFFIPGFVKILEEMLDGDLARLPAYANVVFGVCSFIGSHPVAVLFVYACCLFATVWFLNGARSTQRAFALTFACLPGGRRLLGALDSTRVCTVWSLLMRHRTPLPDILATSAAMVGSPFLAAALRRAAGRVRSGVPAGIALDQESAVDPLLAMTLQYTPEDRLPDEFAELATVFEQRVSQTARLATMALVVISFVFVAILCGSIVIAMFSPLITVIRMFGQM